jgi:hypothetical protein
MRALAQEPVAPTVPVSANRALLTRYCITCHNEKLRTADLLLDKVDVDHVPDSAPVWEKVILKLRAGQMPPAKMPRPDKATLGSFVTDLEKELDAAAVAQPNPGRTGLHRLNRAEYTNAIRDLLALAIDGEALLPADDSDFGFDNIAKTLSVSPLLMERYMDAARKISRLAIGNPDLRSAATTYNLPRNLMQEDRRSEDLPFGSRGGAAINHYFPLDGEYTISVSLQRNDDGYIRGLRDPHQLDFRVDRERIKLMTVGGERLGRSSAIFPRNNRDNRGDPEQLEYEHWADEALQVRFQAKAGSRLVQVAFLKETTMPEGMLMPKLVLGDMGQYKGGEPAVFSVTITGPFNVAGSGETASRQKIFLCHPATAAEEEPCAKKILGTIARRAYRRPVTDRDMQQLMKLYRTGRSERDFEMGIEMALRRIVAGVEFLFRAEHDPVGIAPGTLYPVSDLDLASRLSFFLWSSIPDDELLTLAESGKLHDPAALEKQVRRMLADPKSKALVDNFAGQWLYLRNVASMIPDPREFPDFDADLREAFQKETELFLENSLAQDHGITELLTADYTFVNERLARHYGIPNVYGSHFREVKLDDENRRGLLGQGSILLVTSYGNRTSPVKRGKWVLSQLLGIPPSPPPPNVNVSLEDEANEKKDGRALTIREQMEMHRANPVCASCHNLMDPIGFSMENFDAVGKLRQVYAKDKVPVDASAIFYDGTPFQGAIGLREILMGRRDRFVYAVTEKLLTYSLGREVEYFDAPAVRKIVNEADPNDYRWSSVILGIVKSTPFQMRRSPEL